MAVVKRQPVPWWQSGANVGVLAIFLVLSFAWTVSLAYFGSVMVGRTNAYDSAPVCTSSADLSSCRFLGSARVVRTWMDKQHPAVDVAFDQLGGLKTTAEFDPNAPIEWQRWQPEDQLKVELWQGSVTVVEGVRTLSNPDALSAGNYVIAAWVTAPITLALAIAFTWWLVVYRRARRLRMAQRAAEDAAHPMATEQLPLTPEMTSFLQKEADLAAHPIQGTLAILGLASVIPAIGSVLFALEHYLFNPFTPFMWVMFLGLGAIVAFGVLHDARQERRDLVGDVFNRATGPFSVKVNQGRYGTTVQVVVGLRALGSVNAPPLESIESGVGTVDYLPISGDLLEVRDQSGNVLWSKFGAASQGSQVDPVKV